MFHFLLFMHLTLLQSVLPAAVICLWKEFSLQPAHTEQANFCGGSAVGYSCRVHPAR